MESRCTSNNPNKLIGCNSDFDSVHSKEVSYVSIYYEIPFPHPDISVYPKTTYLWMKQISGTKVNKQFFTGYQVDGYQQL